MIQTIYLPCPRIVTKHFQRENAWGAIEDCEPEDACGWDVEFLVKRSRTDAPDVLLQQTECDSCGKEWTGAEEIAMEAEALNLAMLEPFKEEEPVAADR